MSQRKLKWMGWNGIGYGYLRVGWSIEQLMLLIFVCVSPILQWFWCLFMCVLKRWKMHLGWSFYSFVLAMEWLRSWIQDWSQPVFKPNLSSANCDRKGYICVIFCIIFVQYLYGISEILFRAVFSTGQILHLPTVTGDDIFVWYLCNIFVIFVNYLYKV